MQQRASKESEFRALRDVSFEIERGDVVGFIGRNGAGKSTLLKILSRITDPTEGVARLRGRVASLLEVGTGFHAELSGRENIYLNGAILGMKKAEITRKFDEIVAFAEVEPFLDMPVKRYSSGMYVRLAFAVAAHLEPEILIIDEVLAVGDAAFQKRCLGKISQVAHGMGRTVLFVSHNMAAVRSLCKSFVVLENGHMTLRDTAEASVARYLNANQIQQNEAVVKFILPGGDAQAWMTTATFLCNGVPSTSVTMGESLSIEVTFEATRPIRYPRVSWLLSAADGTPLLNASNRFQPPSELPSPVTGGTVRCDLGMIPLAADRYFISLRFGDPTHDSHVVERVLAFDVTEMDLWGSGRTPERHISPLWWPTQFVFTSPTADKIPPGVTDQA